MHNERPDPNWPEWVIRQGSACIFIQAPTPEAAVETAARRIGPMGGWRVGPDVRNEVFASEEYLEHAQPAARACTRVHKPIITGANVLELHEESTVLRGDRWKGRSARRCCRCTGHGPRGDSSSSQCSAWGDSTGQAH